MRSIFKFMLGFAALLIVAFIFFNTQKSSSLEKSTLKHWLSASKEQRTTAVKIAVAGNGDIDLIVACVNKIASLPDSGDMDITTAIIFCNTGTVIKDNT